MFTLTGQIKSLRSPLRVGSNSLLFVYCKYVCPNETTVQFEDNFINNYQKIYNTSLPIENGKKRRVFKSINPTAICKIG